MGSLGTNVWNNPSYSKLSSANFQYEFSKMKGHCKSESFKLPIPSPSCVQPPARGEECAFITGLAKSFCQGYSSVPPKMKCDYSSVNAAKNARTEIFKNCMHADGWSQNWKSGIGTDTKGGLFEKVALANDKEYYVKLSSVSRSGDIYKAIVRLVYTSNDKKSSQFLYTFDKQSNTFKVENSESMSMNAGSAALILFNRLKQLAS